MTGNRAKEYYEKSLRALYPATGIIASLVSYKLKSPVFIVGTGRCGTTLLVKILQSHPDLLGFPDEANHLWHPLMYPFLFTYDVSQVSSTNYKVGDFSKIPSWERCLKEMAPAMNSKGYL